MARSRHKMTNVMVNHPKTGRMVNVTLFLDIDWERLAQHLAHAALANKSSVTRLVDGQIKAEARVN